MRKMLAAALLMCTVAIIPMLLIPTVLAKKPTSVSGILYYIPYIDEVRFANDNVFLDTHEVGNWTGDIEGISTDDPCRVVIHDADGFPATNFDFMWYTGIATFTACTVDGKTGGLVMRLVGKNGGPGTEWSGKWVILKGTGELEGIHGQGTWRGLGWLGDPNVPGIIPYEGWIHFD